MNERALVKAILWYFLATEKNQHFHRSSRCVSAAVAHIYVQKYLQLNVKEKEKENRQKKHRKIVIYDEKRSISITARKSIPKAWDENRISLDYLVVVLSWCIVTTRSLQ